MQRYSFLSIAPFASSFLPCNATIRALLGYTFLKAIAALIAWRLTAKRRLSKMKNLLRAALLSSMLLLFAHHATAQVAIGIQIGPPPPPRHYVVPVGPGPEYAWVDGYWYPVNGHYVWHKGYWTRPPYAGARWVGPRHDGGRFYAGYWDGPHGRFEHDHHWDHDHDRDHDRWHH
jgi:hypothetical protein